MKALRLGLLMWIFAGSLHAQSTINLAEYLTNQAGDTLVFENIAAQNLPYFSILFFQTEQIEGLLRRESDAQIKQEKLDLESWKLLSLAVNSNKFNLEKTIELFPINVHINKTYTSSTNYTSSATRGILKIEAFTPGFESAQTPLRNFTDCLKLEIRLVFIENNTPVRRIELIEWYAKGAGLVKMIKNTYQNKIRTTVAASLTKATLGGKNLEGRKR